MCISLFSCKTNTNEIKNVAEDTGPVKKISEVFNNKKELFEDIKNIVLIYMEDNEDNWIYVSFNVSKNEFVNESYKIEQKPNLNVSNRERKSLEFKEDEYIKIKELFNIMIEYVDDKTEYPYMSIYTNTENEVIAFTAQNETYHQEIVYVTDEEMQIRLNEDEYENIEKDWYYKWSRYTQ